MKGIFLNRGRHSVDQVYAPALMEVLHQKLGMTSMVYTYEMLLSEPEKFRNVEYIFSTWGMLSLTEDEIRKYLPNLKCVFYAAGTVQYFAKPFLACGVKVFSAWMANAVPVAEYTVAQILLANKGYYQSADRYSLGEDFNRVRKAVVQYPGNYDTPVGILGVGAIGQLVCEMLKPFRLKVLAYSRSLTEEKATAMGVEKSDIETIFKTCQVVSNHIADNPRTKGIFTKEHFAAMRPYATFLNTGRGAQVVEKDLADVLSERPDLTAVLDVTWPEPVEKDSPFIGLSNCILTPHIAGSSGNEVWRMAEYMIAEYDRYANGEATLYEVTEEMLERMA